MVNKLNFNNFERDFTESNYKKLLKKIRNKTIFYDEIKSHDKYTLWRHDIDLSVHRAYSLAKIEKSLNIKSTFFIYLGSSFYNVFEKEIRNLILKILFLGHKIGLHFDTNKYDINSNKELEKYLRFEKKILENLFNTSINVFSFHSPSYEILKYDKFKYAKMINAYSKYFKVNVEYCSDSDGYWRHKRLEDFLNANHSKIQVLTHPGWWQKNFTTAFNRVKRCIDGRSKNVEINYIKTFKKLKRKIIY